MRLNKLFEHMVQLIYKKNYVAFCQLTDEDLADVVNMFVADNTKFLNVRNKECVMYNGRKVKFLHVIQLLFYDCVYFVSQNSYNGGNNGQ